MNQLPNHEVKDSFNQSMLQAINFTSKAEDAFYDAVDLPDFKENDAETIFNYLKSKIRLIPFGDYLKRYIYIKAGMRGDFSTIDIREYQHIIIDSFEENHTPKSFSETSAKMSALTKNWLNQASVNRSVVFLLGFGLRMTVDDLHDFLTKALRERSFNFKDPIEVIYWFSFKMGLNYRGMQTLKQKYEMLQATPGQPHYDGMTIGVRNTLSQIKDKDALMMFLAGLKNNNIRYIAFVDSTNAILNECLMGEIYIANPYECFLLMCILSDCPLATYADVWEMSFIS